MPRQAKRVSPSDEDRRNPADEALRRGLAADVIGWAAPLRDASGDLASRERLRGAPIGPASMRGQPGGGASQAGSFKALRQPDGGRATKAPYSRDDIIARGTGFRISIEANPKANDAPPRHMRPDRSEVEVNERSIRASAHKYGVDPDLIRAVIYVESTQGYYDEPLSWIDANASIRPMNINTKYWGDEWGERKDLKSADQNIDGGTRMLKNLIDLMPGSGIEKIATVYNSSKAEAVTDYGARVRRVYREKPWARKPQSAYHQSGAEIWRGK